MDGKSVNFGSPVGPNIQIITAIATDIPPVFAVFRIHWSVQLGARWSWTQQDYGPPASTGSYLSRNKRRDIKYQVW